MNVTPWNQPQTTIGHLIARYNGSRESIDRTALRVRVERLIDNADLRPPGLSSGAVLIVRRIDSPTAISVSGLSQPDLVVWQASLHGQLAALYASAARPALGAVSLNAPGVLFTDPGEMLTCLTRDLLSGQVEERWYWQQVLRDLPRAPGVALPELWSEHAATLPIVFASLRPSELFRAITHFTPLAIQQLIRALHECFDLPSEALAAGASGTLESTSDTQVATNSQSSDEVAWTTSTSRENLPPWEKWLSTTMLPTLLPEARYLLGLGLTLHHAPAFARSVRFSTQSARWLHSEREKGSAAAKPPRDFSAHGSPMEAGSQKIISTAQGQTALQTASFLREAEQRPIRGNEIDAQSSTLEPGTASSPGDLHSKKSLDASSPGKENQSSVITSTRDERLEESQVSQTRETLLPPGKQASLRQEAPTSPSKAIPSPTAAISSKPLAPGTPGTNEEHAFVTSPTAALPTDGVFTCLGGALYLINLLSRLDLLHSWERDESFAEQISGWAIIEALARCLLSLGSLHERYIDDPIWHVMALLDGREPGMPIVTNDMEPKEGRAFHLPASWLQPGGPVSWSAIQLGERLLIFDDEAGFLVVDVPLQGRSFFEATQAEVEAYREQGIEVSWSLGSPGVLPGLSRDVFSAGIEEAMPMLAAESLLVYMDEQILWRLEHVFGFVYYLLARALGVAPDETERLAQLALCHHGQLIAGRTHVDLHMSLEESNIAVRSAGLDRDPGWVPDLARIVYFHFD